MFFSLYFVSNKVDLRAEDTTAWGNFSEKISVGGGIFYFLEDSAPLATTFVIQICSLFGYKYLFNREKKKIVLKFLERKIDSELMNSYFDFSFYYNMQSSIANLFPIVIIYL